MFPFIFLVSTQMFFISLFKNHQIQTFKYSGLKNIKIITILMMTSLMIGVLLIVLFYNLSSNLKNIYLEMKNNYTSDNKYLAVITNNGLWIKDKIDKNFNIINASKIDDRFLINASITELDSEFNVINHIESEKIDISKKLVLNKAQFIREMKKILKENIRFYSNFDYERIQSLFSNLSSLSVIELFELRKNYILLNLSTTEINLQINKIASYPIYLSMMTVFAGIIMFNVKSFNSNTLKISFGLFLSVLIYYMNNFFNVMGKTEKIPIIFLYRHL